MNGPDWTGRLVSGGINGSDVYGLSLHQYLSGGLTDGTEEEQRAYQTQNVLAQVAASSEIAFLNQEILTLGENWKIWVTEFNLDQNDAAGNPVILHDMGHALAIADFTGRMLEQGVEKMFYESLDTNPYYALVNYLNENTSVSAPSGPFLDMRIRSFRNSSGR